jgi:hypothetical protein
MMAIGKKIVREISKILADKEKLTSSTATINKVEMIWNQFGRAN